MRISSSLLLLAWSLCLTVRLAGQAAVEYSTATATGTTGAAAAGKGVSKSIGGVFDSLNKKLGQATGPENPAADTKPAPVTEVRASTPAPTPAPTPALAPKETPSRLVRPAEIREGTPRAELVRDFGKPFMKTSQTDEGVFTETYFYQGADEPVVVTLRNGKVIRVTPPPETPSETQKAPPAGF